MTTYKLALLLRAIVLIMDEKLPPPSGFLRLLIK